MLWCPKCQAGPGGYNEKEIYKVGDKCPRCLKRGKRDEAVGELMDSAEYERKYQERAAFRREEAKNKAPKGQKSVEQHVREAESRLEQMFEERLAKALAEKDKKTPIKLAVKNES